MPKPPRLTRAQHLYRALTGLYPAAFRHSYAKLMIQLFDDIYQDLQALPPPTARLRLASLFLDALASIGREQAATIKDRLNLRNPIVDQTPRPFLARHRRAFIISGTIVLLLGIASALTGFWSYNGPVGYLTRVVQDGVNDEKLAAGSGNTGWDDVTANFVGDYIQAHYYGDHRTDVGVHSPHAYHLTYVDQGKTFTQSLGENLNDSYAYKDPNFDDITCSTQPPTGVRYIHEGEDGRGSARMVAAFSYAGQTEPNLVEYFLRLDQTRSTNGDWKVSDINCLSLSLQPQRPYVTGIEDTVAKNRASLTPKQRAQIGAPKPYEQRNDRSFGPVAP